jgi:hypothetical protein
MKPVEVSDEPFLRRLEEYELWKKEHPVRGGGSSTRSAASSAGLNSCETRCAGSNTSLSVGWLGGINGTGKYRLDNRSRHERDCLPQADAEELRDKVTSGSPKRGPLSLR